MKKRKIYKRVIVAIAGLFLFMNIIAIFHAYKFTHFTDSKLKKTQNPEKLTSFEKFQTLFFGVNNPRPENNSNPNLAHSSILIKSNKNIECWLFDCKKTNVVDSIKGTVIIFHGYGGKKSSMLDKSEEFLKLGFNTVLVDFMGSGGSDGNQTTLGYKEAEEVKAVYDYIISKGVRNVYLFGTSLGAAAILKSINDFSIQPTGIILECPFGTMYQTVCARFKNMGMPTFPMAGILVFWGGIVNGFWAFAHNPKEYAKKINCPALLLYGEEDKNVSRQEIDDIFTNLNGPKTLKTYKLAGHENYLLKYKDEWLRDIRNFIIQPVN